jgi:predicted RNA polymerase sigma factor
VVGRTMAPGVDVDSVERLLRELAPQVLALLVRRHGDFDTCEDAVQEALLAAAVRWPADGIPANPLGWLVTVGSRRWIEVWRNDAARRRREQTAALLVAPNPGSGPAVDDTLTLFMLCCHPTLTLVSQVALTLRAVGGLSTAEIARGLLVPEATVAQRISRAKQRIRASGAQFRPPPPGEHTARVAAVLSVLYLIFNEGYTASAGSALHRPALTGEAIWLTRQLHTRLPDHGEAAGLLALMLLTDARRPARTDPDGGLIPLAEQDRSRWHRQAIAEGTDLLERALARSPVGPYQLQAAIAAVHAEATRPEDTDWPQILHLYDLLHIVAPGPMVTLNRIVAAAMVHGPHTGLRQLADAATDPALAGHYRVDAIRAHLLDMAGDHDAARTHYQRAARRTLSLPEQRYLQSRAGRRRLTGPD